MNNQELIKEFIRIEEKDSQIVFSVRLIEWHGPHEPVSSWKQVYLLPIESSPKKVEATVQKILNHRSYFRNCDECGEKNPDGWMHNKTLCQSCAEMNHGITY